jgi:predicted SAM-dependent methyltransferase
MKALLYKVYLQFCILKSKLAQGGIAKKYARINLCGGDINIPGYCNIDLHPKAEMVIDLEKSTIPFKSNSVDSVVCISAINYFDRRTGQNIINDVYRSLKKGGVARFASQDLKVIATYYVERNTDFFYQKSSNGADRFIGASMGDKFNSWFYGYETVGNKHCKYVYDYETLEMMFKEGGFSVIENMAYQESRLEQIDIIDNRPEQMFFLEAVK